MYLFTSSYRLYFRKKRIFESFCRWPRTHNVQKGIAAVPRCCCLLMGDIDLLIIIITAPRARAYVPNVCYSYLCECMEKRRQNNIDSLLYIPLWIYILKRLNWTTRRPVGTRQKGDICKFMRLRKRWWRHIWL